MKKKYAFDVELVFDPSFDAMLVSVVYETDDPDFIVDCDVPAEFTRYVLDNISILPHSYVEKKDD